MASKLPRLEQGNTSGYADRHTKLLVIGGFFAILLSFFAGFFWGVGSSLETLSIALDQEAFSDQISASLMPMQESDADDDDTQVDEQAPETDSENNPEEQGSVEEQSQQVCAERTYHAQLAGFGNKQSAYRFAQKLIKRKIPVIVNAVHSKTNRGKSITWYQVVTESYSTKEELVALVEQLKETEKLKDPQIVYG
jgi:septal ring-binding cell division protein DamX